MSQKDGKLCNVYIENYEASKDSIIQAQLNSKTIPFLQTKKKNLSKAIHIRCAQGLPH